MHLLGADGKILSLKVLDQRGFESHISGGWIHIMKGAEVYTKATVGRELYEVKIKIVPLQEKAAIKRNMSTSNPSTWHNKSELVFMELPSQETMPMNPGGRELSPKQDHWDISTTKSLS